MIYTDISVIFLFSYFKKEWDYTYFYLICVAIIFKTKKVYEEEEKC